MLAEIPLPLPLLNSNPCSHPELGFWVKLVDPDGRWLQAFSDARNKMHMEEIDGKQEKFFIKAVVTGKEREDVWRSHKFGRGPHW